MNMLIDLDKDQIDQLDELAARLKARFAQKYKEFTTGLSQRAYAGESVVALNAESLEMARWKSAFSRSNLMRVIIEKWLTIEFDGELDEIIQFFQASDRIKFAGRHSHRVEEAVKTVTQTKRKPVINLANSQGSLNDGEE